VVAAGAVSVARVAAAAVVVGTVAIIADGARVVVAVAADVEAPSPPPSTSTTRRPSLRSLEWREPEKQKEDEDACPIHNSLCIRMTNERTY
jgi:hypothetical protein